EVAAGPAGLSAVRAPRGVAPTLRDERIAQRGQGLELAHDAVAAVVPAAAAGPAADGVLDGTERELELERLERSVQGIAHGHMHRARAVGVRACSLAAADRLVVHRGL